MHLLIGGNSGIGLALAQSLVAQNQPLLALSRSTDELDKLGIATLPFDATSPDPLPALPEAIDSLTYCPGTINLKPFHRLTQTDFLHDLQVNLLGAVRVLQAALPSLKKGTNPSVVLFSSVAATKGLPFHASIAAAKGAIESLTRSLAAEWAPTIRVNAIAPSLTDTPLAANLLSDDTRRKASADRHPLKTIGHPTDVAALINFLHSDSAKFITAQIHHPDGGLSSLG